MSASETYTGQPQTEPQPFLRFDGVPHLPLGDGLTLVYREGDNTVTIVGIADLLQAGSVVVLG